MTTHKTRGRLAGLILPILLASPWAHSAEDPGDKLKASLSFSQPAESLSIALRELAKRAGVAIVFSESDLKGLEAPALSGDLTVLQALDTLLRDTRFEYVTSGATVAVRAKAAPLRAPGANSIAAPASRAPPAAPTEETEIQEITVTAQRRSQRLQDVPVSVTALSGDSLAQRQMNQPEDLQAMVPNLQAMTGLGQGVPVFALRGLSLNDSAPNQSGPIGIYYDEVYKGSLALYPIGLYDLQRVEVLRGPQGTLYGKNTTAGAINYITNGPTFTTEGDVSVGTGNYGLIETAGFVSGPLSENIAGRLAYTYRYSDGFIKNLAPGAPDMESVHQIGVRGSLLFKLSQDWDMTVRAEYGRQTPQALGYPTILDTSAGVTLNDPYANNGRRRETYQSDADQFVHTMASLSMNNTWRISGDLSLISVTSYDHGSTGAPFVLPDIESQFYYAPNIEATANQVTEDIRLASSGDAPLQYIVGAYYSREDQSGGEDYAYPYPGTGTCDPSTFAACNLVNSFRQLKQSGAVYADASYHVLERLTLRGGLRYTHDEGNVHDYNSGYYNLDGVTPVSLTIIDGRAASTTNNVSWKAGLEYAFTPDAMAYYTHSTGFRGASFNFNAFNSLAEIQPSRPETIRADEAGFKTQWLDRLLTFNGSFFYYDYKNYVADNFLPNGLVELYGIPDTRIYGGELEWSVTPIRRLTISGGLGVTEAKIRQGELGGTSLAGNQLPITSKISFNSSAEWLAYQGNEGSAHVSLDAVTFIGRRYFDLYDTVGLSDGGYTLFNAQAKLRTQNDRFGVSLWVKNLTNRYYYTQNYGYAAFGFDTPVLGDPRTYGISFDAKF